MLYFDPLGPLWWVFAIPLALLAGWGIRRNTDRAGATKPINWAVVPLTVLVGVLVAAGGSLLSGVVSLVVGSMAFVPTHAWWKLGVVISCSGALAAVTLPWNIKLSVKVKDDTPD